MDVVWHYYDGVEFVTFLVIVQAVLEYCVSGFWRK